MATWWLAGCATPAPPPALADTDRQLRLAATRYQEGRPADALRAYQRAYSLAERIDDSGRLALALLGQGASALRLGRHEAARAAYALARDEAQRGGESGRALQAALGLAESARQQGHLVQAATGFAGVLADPAGGAAERARAANGLALVHLAQGETALAERLLADARPQIPESDRELLAATLANQARARLAQGQPAAALALARQALELDRARLDPLAIADDHLLLAEIMTRRDNPDAAGAHRRRGQSIRKQLGLPDAPDGLPAPRGE